MYVYFFHYPLSLQLTGLVDYFSLVWLFVFYHKVSLLIFYKAVLLYKGKYENVIDVKREKKIPTATNSFSPHLQNPPGDINHGIAS